MSDARKSGPWLPHGNQALIDLAAAITMVAGPKNIFTFRDRGQLVGEIHGSGSPVAGPWIAKPASVLAERGFCSWTAAVFYLKALHIEALTHPAASRAWPADSADYKDEDKR